MCRVVELESTEMSSVVRAKTASRQVLGVMNESAPGRSDPADLLGPVLMLSVGWRGREGRVLRRRLSAPMMETVVTGSPRMVAAPRSQAHVPPPSARSVADALGEAAVGDDVLAGDP
jgi:hypothetical protein